MPKGDKLQPKVERFIHEYLVDLNGAAAYRRVYGNVKAPDVSAARLLATVKVREAVEAAKRKQLEKSDLSAARVLEEIRRLAFGDRTAILACKTIKQVQALPPELRALVSDFQVFDANIAGLKDGKTDKVRRVNTYSKSQALDLLARHFKLLTDVIETDNVEALLDRLDRGRARNAARKKG